jgi:hypothetical protein
MGTPVIATLSTRSVLPGTPSPQENRQQKVGEFDAFDGSVPVEKPVIHAEATSSERLATGRE